MRVIFSDVSLDPYFNLASEQYLLEGKEDVFMLWRNGRSVIIGRNQNAYGEVNVPFCDEKKIKVARRLTGGGAVFHDEGNVNFSFITDSGQGGIDFARFLVPVVGALGELGITAEINGRNDLTAGGFKISGNAQCVYRACDGRKRLLHHGTLLFSADISEMSGALNVNREKLQSKGIKSVSSRVKNIRDIDGYRGPDDPFGFADAICRHAEAMYGSARDRFGDGEINEISFLAESKFSTWDWNFGPSPSFSDGVSRRFPYGTVEISFSSRHGIIEKAEIHGDFFGEEDAGGLAEKLCGCRLTREDIEKACAEAGKYIFGSRPEDISELIVGRR